MTVNDIPDHLICPLTMEIMKEPLFSKYGHNFERSAILEWVASGENTCPMTRQPLFPSMLIPNHSLRLKIKAWKAIQEVTDEDVDELEDGNNADEDTTISSCSNEISILFNEDFRRKAKDLNTRSKIVVQMDKNIQAIRRQSRQERHRNAALVMNV